MSAPVRIDARFNGPPTSGNGGYSCGVLAALIDGAATVRLHMPPPLDTGMRVEERDEGVLQLYEGDRLVAEASPAELSLALPRAPSPKEAAQAMAAYPCYEDHFFPTCFVCGPGRADHDGLELFPGPVAGRDVVACIWRPAADLLDGAGAVRPEVIWAALDCPGYFAGTGETLRPALLGELCARIDAPVPGGETLVVYAWRLGGEGRKFHAGSAVASGAGEVLACARSTWIELKT